MTATGNEAVRLSQLRTLAGTSSNSVSLLSASGNEAVTIDQAAEALGFETAGGATGQCAITIRQLKMAYEYNPLKIVTWADGTDEQIAAMVAAADAGGIVLSDYWSAGDTRTVQLSAMGGGGVYGENHAPQSVQFVLTDPGHYTLANGKPCSFVVLQKDCLKEYGAMNLLGSSGGGWNDCPRRTWCNSVYRNAIPSSLRGIFKQFKVRTARGTGSGSTESTDWFSLFSEKEIFGSTTYANSSAESKCSQLDYYKTSSNQIKRANGSASYWWERSNHGRTGGRFCCVSDIGAAGWETPQARRGLAPFGCI